MTSMLIVLAWFVPATWLVYTGKAWWVARHEFSRLPGDAKLFYLLVAPPLTLALDVLFFTDRLFYRPTAPTDLRRAPTARDSVMLAAVVAALTETLGSSGIPCSPVCQH